MFIGIKIKDGARKVDPARVIELQCDECQKTYTTNWTNVSEEKFLRPGKNHFCGLHCANISQRTGVLKQKKDKLFQERYGSNSPFGNKLVQEKAAQTNIERYGTPIAAKNEEIKKKSSEILKVSYHRPETKAKKAKTCLERYGNETYMSSKHAKEAREKTFEERYGPGIKAPIQIPGVFEKIQNSPTQNIISKAENRFNKVLCELFGKDDVKRQQRVNGWAIDFYIVSLQTYVEFDGLFWHGLYKSIEELKLSNKEHDQSNARKYDRDRFQDQWFKDNNLKLVRITDKEFYQWKQTKTELDEIKKKLY